MESGHPYPPSSAPLCDCWPLTVVLGRAFFRTLTVFHSAGVGVARRGSRWPGGGAGGAGAKEAQPRPTVGLSTALFLQVLPEKPTSRGSGNRGSSSSDSSSSDDAEGDDEDEEDEGGQGSARLARARTRGSRLETPPTRTLRVLGGYYVDWP